MSWVTRTIVRPSACSLRERRRSTSAGRRRRRPRAPRRSAARRRRPGSSARTRAGPASPTSSSSASGRCTPRARRTRSRRRSARAPRVGVSPIITPLRTTFSCAVSSGLKPTPSSMHGATRPAMRIRRRRLGRCSRAASAGSTCRSRCGRRCRRTRPCGPRSRSRGAPEAAMLAPREEPRGALLQRVHPLGRDPKALLRPRTSIASESHPCRPEASGCARAVSGQAASFARSMTRIAFVSREVYPFDSAGLGNYVAFTAAALAADAEVTIITTDPHERATASCSRPATLGCPPESGSSSSPSRARGGRGLVRRRCTCGALGHTRHLVRLYPDGGPDLVEFPDYLGEGCVTAQAKQTLDRRLRNTPSASGPTPPPRCARCSTATCPTTARPATSPSSSASRCATADRFLWPGGGVLDAYRRLLRRGRRRRAGPRSRTPSSGA